MGTNLDPTELTQGPRCLDKAPDAVGKLLLRWLPWKRVRLALKPNSCPQTNVSRHSTLARKKTTDITRADYDTPVVSFVNQGDGRISVDLCGRVMTNENELYAMAALTTPAHLSASNLATMISTRHVNCCYVPQPPIPPPPPLQHRNDSFFDCDNQPPPWYFENMSREQCVNMLAGSAIGSFAVRSSSSRPGCYALSISVPVQVQPSGVAHYLIIRTSHGSFKIKGFAKEHHSVQSLITHHYIMQELLPCTLRLDIFTNSSDDRKEKSFGSTSVNSNSNSDACSSSTTVDTKLNFENNNEELVDVDADPDYQRIISHFRKSMASVHFV